MNRNILALGLAALALSGCAPEAPARRAESLAPPPVSNDAQKDLFALKIFRQAQVAAQQGEAAEAVRLYRQALPIYEALGDFDAQAAIHNDLGLILRRAGQHDKAQAILTQAVELGRKGRSPEILAEALLNLGMILYDQGQDAAAEARLGDAIAAIDADAQVELRGLAHNARGNVRRKRDNLKGAIEDYQIAAGVWSELDRANFAAVAHMNIGYCQILDRQGQKAAATLQVAVDLLMSQRPPSADREALVPHLEALIRHLKTDEAAARAKVLQALGRSPKGG